MADAHKDVVMDMRKIKVLEAVPTSKYLYLKVSEGDHRVLDGHRAHRG